MAAQAAKTAENLKRESEAWMNGHARELLEDVLAELVRRRPAQARVRELVLRRVMAAQELGATGTAAVESTETPATPPSTARSEASTASSLTRKATSETDAPLALFAVNEALFRGYVEQTSPACAAAVTAGCLNAIRGLHGEKRWTQPDVLRLLSQQMQMRVEKVQQRIERLLGPNCSLESLRRDVDALGIEKLSGLRKHILASGPIVTDEAMDTSTATSQLLYALFSAPSIGFPSVKGELSLESARESQKSGGNDDEVEGNNDDDEDGDEGEDEDENKSSRRASADASGTWDHEKLFKDWLRKARGLRRLLDANKPSTACIGNWGIKGTVALISAEHSADFSNGLECIQLLGKSVGCKFRVSARDSKEQIEIQWMTLVSYFSRQQIDHNATALVYHLKNHYAPIYALRVKANGNRELLSSRRGQAPKHWISFHDVRSTLLRWNGYCIMAIHIRSST